MLHYFSIYSSNSSTLIQSRSRPTNFFRQFIQMNKQSKPVDRVKEDNYNAYTFASLGIISVNSTASLAASSIVRILLSDMKSWVT